MIVRELITRLGFNVDDKKLKTFDHSLERSAGRAQMVANTIRNVFYAFAASSIVKTADELQNLRARLAQLPQTQGDVGAAFDEVADRASKAGASIDAYGTLYVRIGNAAKKYITTQEDLLGITDTISKSLTVSGASAQEAASVMLQFSQALSSGVLQGEEFRAMAEAAPQFLDKLAETLNMPRENLKKLASEGKLTSQQVIEATRKMSSYFDEKFKKMPMTVGRAITIVTNRLFKFLDNLNRETGFIQTMADGIIYFFDALEIGLKKVIDLFGSGKNAIQFFGIALSVAIGAKAIQMLMAFKLSSIAALLPWLTMTAVILGLALVIEDLYVGFKGGDSVIFQSLNIIKGYYDDFITYIVDAIETAVNGVTDYFDRVVLNVSDAISAVMDFLKKIKTNALKYLGSIKDVIYNIFFEPVVNAFKNAFSMVKDIFKFSVGANGAPVSAAVSPVVSAASRPNIQNTTNVAVTVPQGTSAQQAEFLRSAAQRSFNEQGNAKIARDISLYAP